MFSIWESGKLKYQRLPTNLLPEHSNAQLPILLYIPEAKKDCSPAQQSLGTVTRMREGTSILIAFINADNRKYIFTWW